MAVHRYWRLYITRTCDPAAGYTSLMEVGLRTSIGGSSVAVGAGGTATADSVDFGWAASYAFDGSLTGTGWHTAYHGTSPVTHWIKYDFGAGNEKDIVECTITPQPSFSGRAPSTFQLQYSDDDSSWTTLFSVEDEDPYSSGEVRAFNANQTPTRDGNKTFWRIYATATQTGGAGAGYLEVAELSMALTGGGANQCTGGRAYHTVAQTDPTYSASVMVDGNAATYASTAPPLPSYVGYRFASAKDITEVKIKARAADGNYAPTTFSIQYWDGAAFQTVYTTSGLTWTAGEEKTFSFTLGTSVTGVGATGSPGSVAAGHTVALTGAAATGAVGNTAPASPDVTTGITGVAAAGTAGSVGIAHMQALTGVAATGAPGTVAASGGDPVGAWSQVRFVDSIGTSGAASRSLPAMVNDAGNHLVVSVRVGTNTDPGITVSDTSGNTYAEAVEARAEDPASFDQYLRSYYALNIAANASNVITVSFTGTSFGAAPVSDISVQEFHSSGAAVYDTGEGKISATSTASVTSDAYTTSDRGVAAAREYNLGNDTIPSASTFTTAGWTTNTRPDGHNATGWRRHSAGESGATVTFANAGTYSSRRFLSVVALKDAPPDTTLALTGVAGTGVAGTVNPSGGSYTRALTGVEAASAPGSVSVGVVAITGVAASGIAGSIDAGHQATSGVAAAGAPGAVTFSTILAITGVSAAGVAGDLDAGRKAITGAGATTSVGSVAGGLVMALSGVGAAGSVGRVDVPGPVQQLLASPGTGAAGTTSADRLLAITGVQGDTASGALSQVWVVSLTGVQGSGNAGALTYTFTRGLTGAEGSAQAGAIGRSPGTIVGVAGSGAVGNMSAGQLVSGVAATGATGVLVAYVSKALTGVAATGAVARVGSARPRETESFFVSTPTTCVTTSAKHANAFIVSSAVSVEVTSSQDQTLISTETS